MMPLLETGLFLSGAIPLALALRANRRTSLLHALLWATAAWLAWSAVTAARATTASPGAALAPWRYLALALSGCAGVAVLGARRPGAAAWHFVVAGLLAVLLLPLAEGWIVGTPLHLSEVFLLCLGGTLGISALNYLPTGLAPAAILFGLGCIGEVRALDTPESYAARSSWWIGLTPWVAILALRWRRPTTSEFDRLWRDYRDRFGFVWGQRLREQFNHAARHAGWPVVLRWQGIRLAPGAALPEAQQQEAMLATLRALMKRFLEPAS